MNFLNHLEAWLEEGSVRSNTLVAAKCDEIDKELELRLHLHEPRMKRAEMDIHNVRAGTKKTKKRKANKSTENLIF